VLHSHWTPLFCDVDEATGAVPDTEWQKALEDKGAAAILFVHMFGNPCDPAGALRLCREAGAFFIEDACQALGTRVGGRPCGSFGDVSILSFGRTKHIDAGSGGMLMTDDDSLADCAARAAGGAKYLEEQQFDALDTSLHSLYYERKDRFLATPDDPHGAFSDLIGRFVPLIPAPWRGNARAISERLQRMDGLSAARRRKAELYAELLAPDGVRPIGPLPESAPWRFSFRLPGITWERQVAISNAVRAAGMHISNWYLPAHWLLPRPVLATGTLANTLRLSREVFQLWLDEATDEAAVRAAAALFARAARS
jgi:dTDP-4-amino-4,6-dideoxygalactose transaminase